MTGRELLLRALRCEGVERTPWTPFVGCHAAALLGISAEEYLKSEDRIVEGISAAIQRYQPDGIPVLFDLQVEAEVLGCELRWAEDNPPSVVSSLLGGSTKIDDLAVPGPDQGRIGITLSAARRLREAHPDIALYGLVTGPFTLALHLQGTDIFMRMFDDPEEVHRTMDFCRRTAQAMAGYYVDAGCDIVALVDPMTSQIGPDQFTEFVSPHVAPVFDFVRGRGAIGSFFVCGHAQKNIEVMCDTRPENISVDENIPLDYVRDICLERGVSFGGNMQLTTVLLLGKPEDAERNAMECIELAGGDGFILAPGCDLPYATPPENLEAVGRLVRDSYRQDVVKSMAARSGPGDVLDMTHYGEADKVIVDIVTLDSEACAPCQYMVEAVRKVAPQFDGIVEWREHKIKYREEVVFMASLMVKNVPTICIDGRIRFISQIPPRDELIAAIQERINEKMRLKIRRRRAAVYLLGTDAEKMTEIESNVRRAMRELGTTSEIKILDDEEEIKAFGVHPSQTPAVVVARYQLKSSGGVPEVAAIKEWLRET